MIDPKLKKIEIVDEDWQQPPRTPGIVREGAGRAVDHLASDRFKTLVRTGVLRLVKLRLPGTTGRERQMDV